MKPCPTGRCRDFAPCGPCVTESLNEGRSEVTTPGQRQDGTSPWKLEAGGYCPVERDGRRVWMARTPNGHLGDLSAHDVTEHDDGTISVSPSILVSNPREGELWHGYLERGVWRQV